MNTQQRRSLTRVVTIGLWGSFLLCNLLLVVSMAAQVNILGILLLLFVFVGELALLARYVKWVAQWRSILLFWGIYSLARVVAAIMVAAGNDLAATLALLWALYMMFAGWFAIISLAIRRDVSVPYLVIAVLIGPIALRGQAMASGGVLAWLTGQGGSADVQVLSAIEPVAMSISCMMALALLTFVPHFLVLLWREWQGVRGPVPPAPAMPDGVNQTSSLAGPQP